MVKTLKKTHTNVAETGFHNKVQLRGEKRLICSQNLKVSRCQSCAAGCRSAFWDAAGAKQMLRRDADAVGLSSSMNQERNANQQLFSFHMHELRTKEGIS
ncbi:hypothetical protein QQF64_034868 [Cirrhinus molitorella]|uniref:Uncharacterized protein n=1 Tax=Cirrhinus molitorella TaxID=172907 RepID=A0ABR3NEZ8_9TELE